MSADNSKPVESNLPEIELRLAFAWTCDRCGIDNYHNGVIPCMDEHLEFWKRDTLCIGQDEEGVLVLEPSSVVCSDCGQRYRVQGRRESE